MWRRRYRRRRQVPLMGLRSQHSLAQFLVAYSIKDGKKELAVKLVNEALDILTDRAEISDLESALDKIVDKIMIWVGFFKRRAGARNFQVPYMMSYERAYRHSIKRLYKLTIKNKKKFFAETLGEELVHILSGDKSFYLAEKEQIHKLARANRTLSYMIAKFKLKEPQSSRLDLSKLA